MSFIEKSAAFIKKHPIELAGGVLVVVGGFVLLSSVTSSSGSSTTTTDSSTDPNVLAANLQMANINANLQAQQTQLSATLSTQQESDAAAYQLAQLAQTTGAQTNAATYAVDVLNAQTSTNQQVNALQAQQNLATINTGAATAQNTTNVNGAVSIATLQTCSSVVIGISGKSIYRNSQRT